MPNYREYRSELREYLREPESGMLLKAADYSDSSPEGAFFQLTSGKFAREFVTIWEIFDDRKSFAKCITMLARKAIDIRESTYFSSIVTCTDTARELGSHIEEHVGLDGNINFKHFGDYPSSLPTEELDFSGFVREQVLILTDIVASGNLIQKLGNLIESKGGRVVAVLSVAITDGAMIEATEAKGWATLQLSRNVRIHSLTDHEIEYLTTKPTSNGTTIKIDPVTVLPQENLEYPSKYLPLLHPEESFSLFKKSDSLQFGIFQFDEVKHTAAIDFDRLLNRVGDEIWDKISPIVSDADIFVTSYKKDDMVFSEFVHSHLKPDETDQLPVLLTVKRDTRDTPYFTFNLKNKADRLTGKRILLTMATCTTSAEMRNIVTLLASYSVESVTVLCLLSRMGVYAIDFVNRIEHLLNGGERTDSVTFFKFVPIFSMPSFHSRDLDRMQQQVEATLRVHSNKTRVPNFRRLAKQYLGYISPMATLIRDPLTRSLFSKVAQDSAKTRWGKRPNIYDKVPIERNADRLSAFSCYAALNRDYNPLIEEVTRCEDRYTLFYILQILISDIEFLRFTGDIDRFRKSLEEKLKNIRRSRFDAEEMLESEKIEDENVEIVLDEITDQIEELFELELHVMFCLAMSIHFDSPRNYQPKYFIETVFCDDYVSNWEDFTLNLYAQFGDERFMYCISLMLFGAFNDFADTDISQPIAPSERENGREKSNNLKRTLKARIEKFDKTLESIANSESYGDVAETASEVARLKSNINLLLTELGTYDLNELHQVIRYLQKFIIKYRSGHNPIIRVLKLARNSLKDFPAEAVSNKYKLFRLDEFPSDDVIPQINRALEQATLMQTIAVYIQRLYTQTPAILEKEKRYINDVEHDGLRRDVAVLESLLGKIRIDKQISYFEFTELNDIVTRLNNDFYGEDSHLRTILCSFVVSMRQVLLECIRETSAELSEEEGLEDVWLDVPIEFPSEGELLVLCDFYHLKETLSNLLKNVKHAESCNLAKPLAIRIEEVSEKWQGENIVYLKLWITTGSERVDDQILRNRANTVTGHRIDIEQYGGSLSVFNDESGSYFVLKLISRAGFQQTYEEFQILEQKDQVV